MYPDINNGNVSYHLKFPALCGAPVNKGSESLFIQNIAAMAWETFLTAVCRMDAVCESTGPYSRRAAENVSQAISTFDVFIYIHNNEHSKYYWIISAYWRQLVLV